MMNPLKLAEEIEAGRDLEANAIEYSALLAAALRLAESCEEDYDTDAGSLYQLDPIRFDAYRKARDGAK